MFFLRYTHSGRVKENGHRFIFLSSFYSFIRSILLSFFIFRLYTFYVSLCFTRIIWGHNRTNRRSHRNTHTHVQKNQTERARERRRERQRKIIIIKNKMRKTKNFDAISKYNFFSRLLLFFITIKPINLILFWASTFAYQHWMILADRLKRFFHVKILLFNHDFIWV